MTAMYVTVIIMLIIIQIALLIRNHTLLQRDRTWASDWNIAPPRCAWQTHGTMCLEPPESPTHVTADDVRDPREASRQTGSQHPYIDARVMTRFAGVDPFLLAIGQNVRTASDEFADRGIHLTDGVLAALSLAGDWVRERWRGLVAWYAAQRTEREKRDRRMGMGSNVTVLPARIETDNDERE